MSFLRNAPIAFSFLITAYFVLWNVSQIAMSPLAAVALWRHRRRHTRRARELATRVAVPPLVSIVVPAYNEELTIVDSLRALLALDYTPREVVIVNDGSTDGTLELLQRTFQLVPAPLAFVQPLRSEPVRGIYRSISEPDLVVVDKENGGCKADAVNAGINAARFPLVCVVDADSVLERTSLRRIVAPFLQDPTVIAAGGTVRIANGCEVRDGFLEKVGLPDKIRELAQSGKQYNLAVSLHATTDELRDELVPVNKRWPIRELLDAAREYGHTVGRRVTLEYVLLGGVNDSMEDADRLAAFARELPSKVNIIPYNPVPGLAWKRPSQAAIDAFAERLYPRAPAVTVRQTQGGDIWAACGQLGGLSPDPE